MPSQYQVACLLTRYWIQPNCRSLRGLGVHASTKANYKILGVLVSTRTGAMGDHDDPSYSRHHRRRHQHHQHRQYPDSQQQTRQQHHQSRYNHRDKEEDDDEDDDRTEDTGLATRHRNEAEEEEEEEEVEEGCTDRPNSRWCLFVSQARLCGYGHYKRRCCLTCSKYNLHHW